MRLGLGLGLSLGLGLRSGGRRNLSRIASSLISQYIDGESSEVVIKNTLTCPDLAHILSIAYPQIVAHEAMLQYDGTEAEVNLLFWADVSVLAHILSIAYPQIVVHEALLQYDDEDAPELNSLFWAFEQEPIETLKQIEV